MPTKSVCFAVFSLVAIFAPVQSYADLLVIDRNLSKVLRYDNSGVYVGVFAENVLFPEAIAADKKGNVFVADWGGTVHWFTQTGIYHGAIAAGFGPLADVHVDIYGVLYAAEQLGGRIYSITLSGNVSLFAETGNVWQTQLASDSLGRLFVADAVRNRIMAYDTTTGAELGVYVSGIQSFGITCDYLDRLHVSDNLKCRILTFDSMGNYLNTMTGIAQQCRQLSTNQTGEVYAPCGTTIKLFSATGVLGGNIVSNLWRAGETAWIK